MDCVPPLSRGRRGRRNPSVPSRCGSPLLLLVDTLRFFPPDVREGTRGDPPHPPPASLLPLIGAVLDAADADLAMLMTSCAQQVPD